MGQEKPAQGKVVATKTCQKAMKEDMNPQINMQCQDKMVEHEVGGAHLNVEYRMPPNPAPVATPDQKAAHIAAAMACSRGVLRQCETHVVPKPPAADRGK